MTKARKSHSGEILLRTLKPSVPLNQFSSFIDLKTNLGTSERKELVEWKRFKILAGEGIIESTDHGVTACHSWKGSPILYTNIHKKFQKNVIWQLGANGIRERGIAFILV